MVLPKYGDGWEHIHRSEATAFHGYANPAYGTAVYADVGHGGLLTQKQDQLNLPANKGSFHHAFSDGIRPQSQN